MIAGGSDRRTMAGDYKPYSIKSQIFAYPTRARGHFRSGVHRTPHPARRTPSPHGEARGACPCRLFAPEPLTVAWDDCFAIASERTQRHRSARGPRRTVPSQPFYWLAGTRNPSALPNMFRAFWTSACALAFNVLLVP